MNETDSNTNTYVAGFHYMVTKTFGTTMTSFFDVYEVDSASHELRNDNSAVTVKFALYGDADF
jgi:AraC-like DNA-binding protein